MLSMPCQLLVKGQGVRTPISIMNKFVRLEPDNDMYCRECKKNLCVVIRNGNDTKKVLCTAIKDIDEQVTAFCVHNKFYKGKWY
jgi:hypothetical protein